MRGVTPHTAHLCEVENHGFCALSDGETRDDDTLLVPRAHLDFASADYCLHLLHDSHLLWEKHGGTEKSALCFIRSTDAGAASSKVFLSRGRSALACRLAYLRTCGCLPLM